jgi:SAM-dependent methyltransferase
MNENINQKRLCCVAPREISSQKKDSIILREDSGHAMEIDTALAIFFQRERSRPKRVLDLGCGEVDRKFNGIEVQRCDIHPIETKNFTLCDLNKNFPYKDNSFDWILAVEILEHLENPWHFFRECKRVATNHGIVFFSVPFMESPLQRVTFYNTGNFLFFGETKKLSYRDGFKHITPIFEWQLDQIFTANDLTMEERFVVETTMNKAEILVEKIRIKK